MSLTIVMQELTTVSLSASGQTITQQESLWPDLGPYQDLSVLIYFAQVPSSFAGSPTFYIQTAPLKEEAIFSITSFALVTVASTPSMYPGWNVLGNFHLAQTSMFARYVRWSITNGTSSSTNTWQFRILLIVNPSPS